ncbi:RimJ/RimL family protein N-acetyltransferase [Kribbella sp. VKM Ac-2569]|uniref:GNAT family N-acetyltransferase n=1 Tax=Kribbella sp. VKM Ac-2569 TaxID=2512220 RepID=UPI00102C2A05|nr:GNAT family protein [Kribbella sp. VKM Ac-2569]RZT07460.1 RimJ/RimL family protein N-acetyltransferase [Kribbella sp. VKM Ac-2569]
MDVVLRPVREDDLPLFQRFSIEPGLIGLDWNGFRDAQAPVRRFAEDGFLGKDDGRLMVRTGSETAGLVSWRTGSFDGRTTYWEIGIALLPEYRGRGIGWRAQALLTAYLFEHTAVYRIQASTHPENVAEQKSLEKAGFRLEGVIRGCEFRAGRMRDGYLYSRLRDDPAPELGNGSVTGSGTAPVEEPLAD